MYIRHSFALLLLGLNLLFLSGASRDLCAQNSLPGISEVRFSGNESISTERLNRVLRRLRKGGRYSESSVSAELQRVKDLYLSEGFLRVEIGPPDVRIRAIGENGRYNNSCRGRGSVSNRGDRH